MDIHSLVAAPQERGHKREAILEAMLDVVAECGFHGAPMSLVAQRAEVGVGTIYRYFADKSTVIRACYEKLEEQIYRAVREEYPQNGPVRERFLHVATALIHYFLGAPRDFQFMQQFHDSPYGADMRRDRLFGPPGRNPVRDLFEEGKRRRIVKDLPLPILFAFTFGSISHLCCAHRQGLLALDEHLIEDTLGACWDALKR